MALTIQQANDLNVVFNHSTGSDYPRERVIEAWERLMAGANKALLAGVSAERARETLERLLPADPEASE